MLVYMRPKLQFRAKEKKPVMKNIAHKINLLEKLGQYMLSEEESWLAAKDAAVHNNAWFTPEHIEIAARNIANFYLQKAQLDDWMANYTPAATPKKVGIVMAGNIPLVGFHDLLCGYLSGHRVVLKLSSKDEQLIKGLLRKMIELDETIAEQIQISEMLKGCDAYIATGSNNSARYFEQYFQKWPHIIRRNRTSVAVLDGTETHEELLLLAKDIFTYFGLGCRNVTQVCVPKGYNFTPLMEVFDNYQSLIHHNKYSNNYDYQLAIYLLNLVPYLTNGSVLLVENEIPFSAVAVLHYRYYDDREPLVDALQHNADIQAIVGHGLLPFGAAQTPSLMDYADGVDTMAFLCSL